MKINLEPEEVGHFIALARAAGIGTADRRTPFLYNAVDTMEVPDALAPKIRKLILSDKDWRVRGLKAFLIAQAAHSCLKLEVGGIVFGSIRIATDQQSRHRLLEAETHAFDDPHATFHWKQPDATFVELTAEHVKDIAKAVRRHIQWCSRIEANTVQAINAGLVTTLEQVEIQFAKPEE